MAGFDWNRWHRVHRAASRRFDRHREAGLSAAHRMQRYDLVMALARLVLERAA